MVVYNLQLPYKYDHRDFPSISFGETCGNYLSREIPRTRSDRTEMKMVDTTDETKRKDRIDGIDRTHGKNMIDI